MTEQPATPDQQPDDTEAIQAAIDQAASDPDGGVVHVDGGTPADEPEEVADGGSPGTDYEDDDTAEFDALYEGDPDDVPRAVDGVQDDLDQEPEA